MWEEKRRRRRKKRREKQGGREVKGNSKSVRVRTSTGS
jgi:hypothetical protein